MEYVDFIILPGTYGPTIVRASEVEAVKPMMDPNQGSVVVIAGKSYSTPLKLSKVLEALREPLTISSILKKI